MGEVLSLWRGLWTPQRRRRLRELADEIANAHRIRTEDLIGPSRLKKFNAARQEFCYRAHEAGWSYQRIGMFMGGRHHTSILWHARNFAP